MLFYFFIINFLTLRKLQNLITTDGFIANLSKVKISVQAAVITSEGMQVNYNTSFKRVLGVWGQSSNTVIGVIDIKSITNTSCYCKTTLSKHAILLFVLGES